jgi:hypothetical protein
MSIFFHYLYLILALVGVVATVLYLGLTLASKKDNDLFSKKDTLSFSFVTAVMFVFTIVSFVVSSALV